MSSSRTASSFTATQVRLAFECPRLFYLGTHYKGKTVFIPDREVSGIGKPFHHLATEFISLCRSDSRFRSILSPAAEHLQPETVAREMQQLFYQSIFFPYLQHAIQTHPKSATALNRIWEGLKGLIYRYATLLVTNRHHCRAEEVIEQTFVDRELMLKMTMKLPDGGKQLVRGQFDCLVYNFADRRLCVVEYKTYQPADLSAQLAQVSLYSYMLARQKKQPVNAAVYCVLPDFKTDTFTWEELEPTVHQLIPHKLQQMQQWLSWQPSQPDPPPETTQPNLCQMCPQRQKCERLFGKRGKPDIRTQSDTEVERYGEPGDTETFSASPTPRATESIPPTASTDEIAAQLVVVLQSFGIGVEHVGTAVAPAFIRVKIKPNLGVKVVSLLNRSADLQVQMGIAAPPMISAQAGYVSVDLPRSDRTIASFEQYITPEQKPPTAPLKIAIGVTLEGKLMEADLSDPNTCHFLVGGTTGSGKSEFLRSLLFSLLQRHSPNTLKIVLVDPKRVTFPELSKIPWLFSPIVKDSDRAIELMTELVEEMDRRYQRFEVAGCHDLAGYNQQRCQRNQAPEPPIVCVFDEYADFMAEKETKTILEQNIKRLGAMARAAGIHLIIATQRPEAKVVTPIIRSNLPGRIALKTASEADSAIILGSDRKDAAYLLGKGDLLYQNGGTLHRLQSLFASTGWQQ
jgi:DNA segregation ATPase FtsK/SpoIIIE, S-DNA-T family